MSFTDTARKVSVSLHAFETVGKLAKGLLPEGAEGRAEHALSIIDLVVRIYDAATKGLDGDAPIGDVEKEIDELKASMTADKRDARDVLDDRFPEKG